MKEKPRNMKKYTPRRRRSSKLLQKTQLKDFKHLLEMDVNTFLILLEEGTQRQIRDAKIKVRSDLLKYGADLESIGRDLGEGFPEIIRNYIQSIQQVLQTCEPVIDYKIVEDHRRQAEHLIKKAA